MDRSPTTPARSLAIDPAALAALKWRGIGPPRGGRVVAVAADPADRMVFYFGACAGGVWKTIDGGLYWRCVTDGFLGSAAIGAIAVARADPNVIYAGTGEATIRLDVSYGDGIYKSDDAGRTWRHIGLRDSRHIGRICIDPRNPDIAFVAVLGDAFGPSPQRGVFRTGDGGATWQHVLDRGVDAGAVDIAIDPANPRILFATCWQARRSFWNMSSGGPGSGLFRSTDGGDTWQEISANPGLPERPLGKLGVAVSAARPGRVWALVEALGERTGLYRSDDYGARWLQVSSHRDLMHRPWYYTHVFADPCHAETVYVANLQLWKSTDGGTSFTEIMTPHGDNHDLWIDPADPKRMIEGNDGGACVSFNGGVTWSSIYNQKTAQFYRIDIDDRYPYRVYGTQQDNTSIAVPSASVWGAIALGDCFYPGTGESGFIAVNPANPDIVYIGAIGSSPGGAAALQRYDRQSGEIRLVNVWPEESTGIAPKDLKYRFAWTFPIVFSPHDGNILYAGGSHLFRSTDEGMSWQPISPDLSLNDRSRQGPSGGEITGETAGAEVHATCASVVESPHRRGEIWASTDDGLVHVTRNDGASWQNLTPTAMPELAYVGCVEISPHDADTVYLAATRYKLADYRPYLFRSTDSGRTWHSINGDFPANEITRVVRADPLRRGLLFVGTETGVFFTLDDGQSWSRLPGGLPVVPVYDLKLKGADLVAATHGRSFWILDDITPLRELADGDGATRLFAPRATVRTRLHFGALGKLAPGISFAIAPGIGGGVCSTEQPDGTTLREHLDVGENPPNGAIVYYWLDQDASGPVTLTFSAASADAVASGTTPRSASQPEPPAAIISFRSDDEALAPARRPGTRPGLNRFVWDLKYPGPVKLDPALAPARNKPLATEPDPPTGPSVVPGEYQVELAVGSEVRRARFSVLKDPRLATTDDAYRRQFALHAELTQALSRLNDAVNRIRRCKRQLGALLEQVRAGWNAGSPSTSPALRERSPRGSAAGEGAALLERANGAHADLAAKAKAAIEALAAIETVLVDVKRQSARDVLRNPAGLNDTLLDMINMAAIADTAPTTQLVQVSREVIERVDAEIARLDTLAAHDLARINRLAAEAAVDPIGA